MFILLYLNLLKPKIKNNRVFEKIMDLHIMLEFTNKRYE